MSLFEPSRPAADAESRILPLINVVFLLLIFFMVLGSLSASEPFDVGVPNSANEAKPPQETLRLLMSARGELALEGELISESVLLETLADTFAQRPETRLQLKADGRIQANRVVVLMESLREVGVNKLFLVTQLEGP